MPRELFYKLNEKKKNRIYQVAKQEFVNYSFEDASINRIIQNAKISRGSFYLYFKNKMDVYLYILSENRRMMLKGFITSIEQNKSIFDVFLQMYDDLIAYICSDESMFIMRLIENLNPTIVLYFVSGFSEKMLAHEIDYHKLGDYDLLDINDIDDLSSILEMLASTTIYQFCQVLVNSNKFIIGRNRLEKKFEYMKKGLYKK